VYDDLFLLFQQLIKQLGIKFGYKLNDDRSIAGILVDCPPEARARFIDDFQLTLQTANDKYSARAERYKADLARLREQFPGKGEAFIIGMFAATTCAMKCGCGAYCARHLLGGTELNMSDKQVADLIGTARTVLNEKRAAWLVAYMLKRFNVTDAKLFAAINETRCMRTDALIKDSIGEIRDGDGLFDLMFGACRDCRTRIGCVRSALERAGIDESAIETVIGRVRKLSALKGTAKATGEIYRQLVEKIGMKQAI